jgi:hypothetical protein
MIHHVFACKSNIGDWLSAKGIQSLIRSDVTEYLCDEPFVPSTLKRLSEVPDGELVVIGGGGLFMDYFTPFWRGILGLRHKLRYCIWGVGYCDLKAQLSRADPSLLLEIVAASSFTSVRDDLTRNYLAAGRLDPPVPCPSMAMLAPAETKERRILHVSHYDLVGEEGYNSMTPIIRQFASESSRGYREIDNHIPDGSETALLGCLDLYRNAEIVVTSRLHGCIIGLAMGCKILAVSGDRKIESFMAAAGLSDWVCDTRDMSVIRQRLLMIESQQTPLEFLDRARRANVAIADRILALSGHSFAADHGATA